MRSLLQEKVGLLFDVGGFWDQAEVVGSAIQCLAQGKRSSRGLHGFWALGVTEAPPLTKKSQS